MYIIQVTLPIHFVVWPGGLVGFGLDVHWPHGLGPHEKWLLPNNYIHIPLHTSCE